VHNFKVYIGGIFFLLLFSAIVKAQCPENIGFDYGNFKNWNGLSGKINSDGSLTLNNTGIIDGTHTIFYAKDNYKDPYGGFPIKSPNGSSCCVRLGNSQTGQGAERLTYTFTIPANDPDYSLIYYYAVVFQNPGHLDYQQPKFTAKVFDVTDNKYTDCGSFNFVAASNLPGFQQTSGQVFYKDWSPVTINLLGFAGKTLRLEFTTNDCSLGGHFGYAYLDVNQNCTSPVSGNVFCASTTTPVTLAAPSGFQAYHWFQGTDFTHEIGNTNTLYISPAPVIGSKYAVRIVPYPGIGCEDTIYTTIRQTEPLNLMVKDSITSCAAEGVDLTDPSVTAGSNSDFTYTYYSDAACVTNLIGPQNITTTGTYYIKATTPGGCEVVKPVHIFVFNRSSVMVKDPPPVCRPGMINITDTTITSGSTGGLVYSYWKDQAATQKVKDPTAVDSTGIYYIKATNKGGCSVVVPVTVTIVELPKVVITNPAACVTVDMTQASVVKGSDSGLTFSYWMDKQATQPLANPQNITSSGTYYIEATNVASCTTIAPVNVTVNAIPVVHITDPSAVTFPETVDITATFTPQGGLAYTYWHDAKATKSLASPKAVTRDGTYYIKADNGTCNTIYPVKVTIGKPPPVESDVNVFTPNGDGVNDGFKIKAPLSIKLHSFKIYASWGQLLFETTDINKYWDGTYQGKQMPVGTYYWIFDAFDTYTSADLKLSGSISIVR